MNENPIGQNNLLDTTDCLEAVGVFRGWKNFLFIILVLGLLVSQACFWVVNTGLITPEERPVKKSVSSESAIVAVSTSDNMQDVSDAAKKVVAEPNEPTDAEIKEMLPLKMQTGTGPFLGITFNHLTLTIRIVNAILLLAGVLYCLTILMALKVSLVGRLGGINHVTRAFFLSMIMIILFLPWQKAFCCVFIGAMYTPGELVKWCSTEATEMSDIILRYVRFTGYWLLIFLLLIFAQVRTGRWTKTILRRLEVI
jgi:hypothetical protein